MDEDTEGGLSDYMHGGDCINQFYISWIGEFIYRDIWYIICYMHGGHVLIAPIDSTFLGLVNLYHTKILLKINAVAWHQGKVNL